MRETERGKRREGGERANGRVLWIEFGSKGHGASAGVFSPGDEPLI